MWIFLVFHIFPKTALAWREEENSLTNLRPTLIESTYFSRHIQQGRAAVAAIGSILKRMN